MEYADKKFTLAEKSLLKRSKNSKLIAIDAVLVAPPDTSWNTIRLHFNDFSIDINNRLKDIIVDEIGSLEEFGLLSISEAPNEILSIPEVGTDTTVFQIGKTINELFIVNDVIDIFGNGNLVAKLEYPQAIALGLGDSIIMLDKEVWFSEMIAIKQGDNTDELLHDESVNWEDDPEEDPSTHFEFHTETIEL